ncbi:hypothetical protein HPP92_004653 [Vanilla planifolia]|uniref:Uncharacterized protein n=1 Tax=Vanilla planifolia TaxID=51239 RepID=A0A835VAL1_VANPL|nr:hypothetical protein HPP92_004653 [Vanilla planifolia]
MAGGRGKKAMAKGPISGQLSILRTFVSAFRASYDFSHQVHFLDKMHGMTLLFEVPSGSCCTGVYEIVKAHYRIQFLLHPQLIVIWIDKCSKRPLFIV